MPSEAKRRKDAGWPVLLRDIRDLRVRTKRQMQTMAVVIPAGTEGVVRSNRTGWHLLDFVADACPTCKVAPKVSRCSWMDFEVLR